MENQVIRPAQRACYRFFFLSVFTFVIQVNCEISNTVIVAHLYREMDIVSKAEAERATYIVILFCLTGVIDVGYNFYWIAKRTDAIALGRVLSCSNAGSGCNGGNSA